MTRPFVPLFTAGMVATIAFTLCASAMAQESSGAPEPKMPPMPSMEGQQGDVSKPVTQIPPRKKPVAAEKKTLAKDTRVGAVGTKRAKPPRPARIRRKR